MNIKKNLIIFSVFSVITIIAFIVLWPEDSSKKQKTFFKQNIKFRKYTKKTDDPVLAKKIFRKRIQEYEKEKREKRSKIKKTRSERRKQRAQQKREKSNTVKEKFLKEVYLTADLPNNFFYSEVKVDLDKPIKLIRGDTPYQEARVLIGATTIVPQQSEEILEFVRENVTSFPDMNKRLVSQMQRTVQVQNPQPGLKQITVWEAHNNNQSEVLVYLPRTDKRGSYVLSYSGDSSLIKDNDEYFEELLQSLKPQSAPENVYKNIQ